MRALRPAESGSPRAWSSACLGTAIASGWPVSGSFRCCSPLMNVLPHFGSGTRLGAGSFKSSQNTPTARTASAKSANFTGFLTYALAPLR